MNIIDSITGCKFSLQTSCAAHSFQELEIVHGAEFWNASQELADGHLFRLHIVIAALKIGDRNGFRAKDILPLNDLLRKSPKQAVEDITFQLLAIATESKVTADFPLISYSSMMRFGLESIENCITALRQDREWKRESFLQQLKEKRRISMRSLPKDTRDLVQSFDGTLAMSTEKLKNVWKEERKGLQLILLDPRAFAKSSLEHNLKFLNALNESFQLSARQKAILQRMQVTLQIFIELNDDAEDELFDEWEI